MTQLEQTQSVVLDPPVAAGTSDLFRKVLRAAWLSIGLGLALEVVLLVLAAFTGTAGETPKPFISDLAQKVSWSFIVCVGLAFGSTASKAREGIMGALGLLAAPAGFTAARALPPWSRRSTSRPARSTRCSSPWAAPWCSMPRARWPRSCRSSYFFHPNCR